MEMFVTNRKYKIKAKLRLSTGFEEQEKRDFAREKSLINLLDSMVRPHFDWKAQSTNEKSFYCVEMLDLKGMDSCKEFAETAPTFLYEIKTAIFRAWARSNVDSGAELNLMRIKKALKDFGLK